MKASIITIGDEIVGGHKVDTNSATIASKLGDLGVTVVRISSIGDNVDEIADEIRVALSNVDLVFVTGGLGPTHDDVTKKAVAIATDRELVIDRKVVAALQRYFVKRKIRGDHVIESLAMVPEGSRTVENPQGTAHGLIITHGGAKIYVLPGVPREMKAIFDTCVIEDLGQHPREGFIKVRLLRTIGITESQIQDSLSQIMPTLGLKLAFLPGSVGVDLRLTASAKEEQQAVKALDRATEMIAPVLGKRMYSATGDELHVVVGNMLIGKARTVALAESCTGGLIGHLLTEVPGISACLERGVIAYSNHSKVEVLRVDKELVDRCGSVSSDVAEAMARGVREVAQTDIGVSTTGIAGPGGGSKDKPVGLVYIGLAHERGTSASKRIFSGSRDIIKLRAATHALDMIRCHLLDLED